MWFFKKNVKKLVQRNDSHALADLIRKARGRARLQAISSAQEIFDSDIAKALHELIRDAKTDTETAKCAIRSLIAGKDFEDLLWSLIKATGEYAIVEGGVFEAGGASRDDGIILLEECLTMLEEVDVRDAGYALLEVLTRWAEGGDAYGRTVGWDLMRPPGGWSLSDNWGWHYLYLTREDSPVRRVFMRATKICGNLLGCDDVVKLTQQTWDTQSPTNRVRRWVLTGALPRLIKDRAYEEAAVVCTAVCKLTSRIPLFQWELETLAQSLTSPAGERFIQSYLRTQDGPTTLGYFAAYAPSLCGPINNMKCHSQDAAIRESADRTLQIAKQDRQFKRKCHIEIPD